MADILNPIILRGATTAYEIEQTTADIARTTIDHPGLVSAFVALDQSGDIAGYQYLKRIDRLPGDIAGIASFARLHPKLPGVGRALMAKTILAARAAGLRQINARIRADNVPGLEFYSSMGFQDYSVDKGVPLSNGTPVDRVYKRLIL